MHVFVYIVFSRHLNTPTKYSLAILVSAAHNYHTQFYLIISCYILIGNTTRKMMERLIANIDMFGMTRKSFHSRDAFNIHPTTKHREQDPFPDQLKAAYFVLKNKSLKPYLERKAVKSSKMLRVHQSLTVA